MRKIAATFLAAAAVLAALLFLLPALVSTDWARTEVSRQLSAASGMNIRLDGPVRLSLFPRVAIIAEDISLSTGAGELSIAVPRFSSAITLSSLWSDRLEIQAITLKEPGIELYAVSDGEAAPASSETVQSDPFASLVDTLERLAVNRISIENGGFTSYDATGNATAVSAINADLRVPDLDGEASFALAATKDAQRVELSGTLSALRPVLQYQPAALSIEARLEPSPGPGLSEITAAGNIQLNEEGGYQLQDGRFDIGGQSFTLDALFRPGDRHQVYADLTAQRIDIGAFTGGQAGAGKGQEPGGGKEPDLLILTDFDADVSVVIDELVNGDMRASDLIFTATLRDGFLEARLENLALDAGSLSATVSTNASEAPPIIRGNVVSSGLDIASLAKLVGQTLPLSGELTVNTGFAFRGVSQPAIRQTVNLRGTVGIRGGTLPLEELTEGKLTAADTVSGLNATVEIRDIEEPVAVSGNLVWREQPVAFEAEFLPSDFLSSPSLAEASGEVSLAMSSDLLQASADGVAAGSGAFKGRVSVNSPSVDRLMRWLARTGSEGLQDFSFSGDIDASPARFSFGDAALSLNGVSGRGQGTVELATPLKIRTSLQFAKLDFAALTGGGHAEDAGRQSGSSTDADIPIDLSFLRDFDARINIEADQIGYGKVFAGPMATTLAIAEGKAHFNAPASPFYGGTVATEVTGDGSQDMSSITFSAAISGAEAAALLRDAADFDRVEGIIETNVTVAGSGNTTRSLARSLNGSAALKINDGAIRGIDIADVYNNLVGLLSKGFQENENQKTAFTELSATFTVENGVAQTSDISLLGPLVRMEGSGEIDLANETIDMRLNPRVVASLAGQGGDINAEGIGVPVMVEGALSAPRIYPDLSTLMKDPKGALEMLERFGLPTGKLGLDQFLPNQKESEAAVGNGAADLIGDLIKGKTDDGGGPSGITNVITDVLSGSGKPDQPGSAQPRDAGSAVKSILGGFLKKPAPAPAEAPGTPTDAVPADAGFNAPPANGANQIHDGSGVPEAAPLPAEPHAPDGEENLHLLLEQFLR